MNDFDVLDINKETIHDYKEEIAKIKQVLLVTTKEIERYVRTYSNMDAQKTQHWQGQVSNFNLMLGTTETE